MSTINTNGLDVNYPIPGQNNSTQGFRNNFTNIKQNLNTAAAEITDLQNKVVLKSALANSTLNNDMANTLIANASTLQFRSTMYNLGNALVDNVLVNCSLGDVQYGNLAGNILLDFGSWAPTNTLSTVKLQLGRPNTNANYTITFPSEALIDNNSGWTLLEDSGTNGTLATLTFPHDVTQLNLTLTSTDCGNTIFVQPTNRPYKTTQIQTRTPPSTGQQGDMTGTVCVDPGVDQLVITGANNFGSAGANSFFSTANTSSLYTGLPVVITGVSLEANVVIGNTYYVRNVVSNTTFTLSFTIDGSNIVVASNTTGNTMLLNPVQYMYVAVDDFSAAYSDLNIASTTSPNLITLSANTNVANNNPIIFTGTAANLANTGLESNTVYYVKGVSGNDITISKTRYNGIAGPEYQNINTVSANVGVDCAAYNGRDIFRRVTLNSF
jgi:hypothetical protein